MKIKSISHCGLTVSSLKESVKWYHEMFGMRLLNEEVLDKEQAESLSSLYGVHDTEIHLGFLRARGGGVIELFQFTPSLPPSPVVWARPGFTHAAFAVTNVPRWYRTLKEKGVFFFSEPQSTGKNQWVFLKDPDGNLIELIDLKGNYSAIKYAGGIAGYFMAKGRFKKYYE